MGYSVQNHETGEIDYYQFDENLVQDQKYDEETGEPIDDTMKVRFGKVKSFQIPKNYLRGTYCEEFEKRIIADNDDETHNEPMAITVVQGQRKPIKEKHYKREDYIEMDGVENDIILAYKKVSYHMYFIPSLLFFNIYLAIFLVVFECFLHWMAHHKNVLNSDKSYYYRSPLHVLTSEFCALCRSESRDEIAILTMLNKQLKESKTLKDVTKAIG